MSKPPISEPKERDEKQEAKIRALIERHAAYAESGPTFDALGKYLCRDCLLFKEPSSCRVVQGHISADTGSCRLWDKATKLPVVVRVKQLTQIEAGYSERPEAKGFGCSRCEYATASREPAESSRPLFCGFWGCHVRLLACCSEEDGPDLVLAPGESNSNNEE